jgi:transmembrane sensor
MEVATAGRILLRATAIVALLVGGGLLWRTMRLSEPDRLPQTFATPPDRGDTLVLRDGTTVMLAPGGRLIVAAGYGVARRDVELEGEARFVVARDPERLFRVIAGPIIVRDRVRCSRSAAIGRVWP